MARNKREDIAMLIQFSVSNFLSFNEKETFSMIAGKARKNIDRVFSNKKIKLTKCEVILEQMHQENPILCLHFNLLKV